MGHDLTMISEGSIMSHQGHPPPKQWRRMDGVKLMQPFNIRTERIHDIRRAAHLISVIMERRDELPGMHGDIIYERVRETTACALNDPAYAMFVTTVDRVPCLYTCAYLSQGFYNYDIHGVLEVIIAPKNCYGKQRIRLTMRDAINVFTCWAFANKAKYVTLGHNSMVAHSDMIGKLIQRWGYTRVGELYMMRAA